MTSTASPLLRTVDEMLLDAGETDPRLRATLLSLGALASLPVPEPGEELAALLSAQPSQLGRHRLRRRQRTAAVSLAVIAGMGLGVTGVAATASAPNPHASRSIQHMLQDWAPSWTVAGIPAAPAAPGNLPDGSVLGGSVPDGSVPAGQGTSDQVTREPGTAQPEPDAPGSAVLGTGPSSQDQGRGAVSPGTSAADGVASRNGAGATSGGGNSPDGRAGGGQKPRPAPGSDPAGEPEKADPVTTEKTGAGNAGPGSIWLKKFSR